MKSIKFTILIALCSLIIGGCSKKSTTTPQPHLIAVPQNAAMVIACNAKQIVDKAGLNKLEQYQMFSLIQQEIDNQPAEIRKFIKDFLKDTRTSGLNLDEVFMYFLSNERNMLIGYTFLIDNVKKFEDLLEKANWTVWMDEDRKIFIPDGNVAIQWNDEIAVMIINPGEINILNSDENESILANEMFKTAYGENEDKDIWIFFDIKGLITLAKAGLIDAPDLASAQQYKDFAFSVSFNSEKGSLVADIKIFPEDKASEIYEKYYKKDFNEELYKYFPDKSFIAFKSTVKPLDAYNEYKNTTIGLGISEEPVETTTEEVEIIDESGKVIATENVEVDNYGYAANYNYQVKLFIEQYDEKITAVLSNFTGDVLGSLWSLDNIMVPDAALAAGIVEGKEDDVIALMKEVGFKKNQEGYYSLEAGMVNIHFAVKQNIAYFALTDDAISKFLGNGYSSNITTAKYLGSELKAANIYWYLNINVNDYPAMIKAFINMSQEGGLIMPLLLKLQSFSAKNVGVTGGEMRIKLNDNDYATRVILKQVDELVSQYFTDSNQKRDFFE